MKSELSIIMPMFNSEKTIIDTIKSLEKQSNKLFELIIVNDGSTDKSVELVENYVSQGSVFPIKLISQINRGPSEARNLGIKSSSLKYIMFLDSDDLYEHKMVEIMLDQIKKNNLELVTCGILKKTKKKINILSMPYTLIDETNNIANTVNDMQEHEIFNYVWNKIYVRDILKDHNILFKPELAMGEDFLFNLHYVDKIKSMSIISNPLYIYNTDNSFLTNKVRLDDFENRKGNIGELDNYFKKNNYKKDLSFQYVKIFYSEIFNEFKLNGILKFSKNRKIIKKLLSKKEISDIRSNYIAQSMINNILFFPIKIKNVTIIYIISISAVIIKRLNFNFFSFRSM